MRPPNLYSRQEDISERAQLSPNPTNRDRQYLRRRVRSISGGIFLRTSVVPNVYSPQEDIPERANFRQILRTATVREPVVQAQRAFLVPATPDSGAARYKPFERTFLRAARSSQRPRKPMPRASTTDSQTVAALEAADAKSRMFHVKHPNPNFYKENFRITFIQHLEENGKVNPRCTPNLIELFYFPHLTYQHET